MAILITGGAGFIGSHLTELLHANTDELIVCLDNFNTYYSPDLKRANAKNVSQLSGVTVVEGDFCNTEFCQNLLRKHEIDRIVHLGAYAGVRYSVDHPELYQEVNVGGTLALLEAARVRPQRRFLLVSSSTVYGLDAAMPFQEDNPLGIPASPYGVTKRAAELMGLTYRILHDVPVVCLRPFSVYGPRLRPDLALSIFAKAICQKRPIPLYGDGSVRRDFTHVSDICAGLMSALYADKVVGEAINLGHSDPIQIRSVIQMLEQSLNKTAIIDQRPPRPEDLPTTFASLDKAKRLLNYQPKVSVDDGFPEFCQWFLNWHEITN